MPTPLLDVNVLIALTWPNHVHHTRASRWFASRTPQPWATTLLTELGFVRLSANPAVTGRRVSVRDGLAMLGRIRELDGHQYVDDTSSLLRPTIDLGLVTTSRQTTDAHLVNLCGETGMQLATLDASVLGFISTDDHRHIELLS